MVCVRRAWLDLYGDGTVTLPLESEAGGWYCTELDLGYPEVRDVVNNRPDQDGTDDRTRYAAARAVSANITARGNQPDALAAQFGPYMIASVRPVLHYVLDRPGTPERLLTLRPSGYDWPINGTRSRDVQLTWVTAGDPYARDPVARTSTAWAGSSTTPGRTYNLTFNRIYPPGSGSPVPGIFTPYGDVPARPLLRVYGPITAPWVTIVPATGPYPYAYTVYFRSGYVINAGAWVDVDTATKTVFKNSDPTQPDPGALDWGASLMFPVLTPNKTWRMTLNGSSTSSVTQVQAIWSDRWLT